MGSGGAPRSWASVGRLFLPRVLKIPGTCQPIHWQSWSYGVSWFWSWLVPYLCRSLHGSVSESVSRHKSWVCTGPYGNTGAISFVGSSQLLLAPGCMIPPGSCWFLPAPPSSSLASWLLLAAHGCSQPLLAPAGCSWPLGVSQILSAPGSPASPSLLLAPSPMVDAASKKPGLKLRWSCWVQKADEATSQFTSLF